MALFSFMLSVNNIRCTRLYAFNVGNSGLVITFCSFQDTKAEHLFKL